MRYFDVATDDERFPDRWFLDEPLSADGNEIDARAFTYGRAYVGPRPVIVPIQQNGRKVQFNLAAFDMPVVSEEIASVIGELAPRDIEFFPVTIERSLPGYVVLNTVRREACVDESMSDVTFWTTEDGRPDKVGRYRMVSDLTIDPTRTHGAHIFRIQDFEVALLVSERIKDALESIDNLGVVFEPVC